MHGRRISPSAEIGGVTHLESIIDQQEGPTCGFEAVENTIQLFYPVGNQLSRNVLIQRASNLGALLTDGSGYILDVSGYQAILQDFRIASTWYAFDHDVLIDAVWNDRAAILLVDGNKLDRPNYSRPGSWHAILVTNLITDLTHETALAYVGIDSNFARQQRIWQCDALEKAANAYGPVTMLITDRPMLWPHRSEHYVRHRDGRTILAQ